MPRTRSRQPPALAARARILAVARGSFASGQRPSVNQLVLAAGVSRATFHRLFGSRDRLLAELGIEPDPVAADAVLAAAGSLLARDGLARLSMAELAGMAGISRASLYRLYPGKAALFTAMVRRFSPISIIGETMARLGNRPPEQAMPELAVAVVRFATANLGVVRPLLFEAGGLSAEVRQTVVEEVLPEVMGSIGAYVARQMAAGALQPMHPIAAIQSFAGPIMLHVILRPLLEEGLGIDLDSEAVVRQFAVNWVRGMQPDSPSAGHV